MELLKFNEYNNNDGSEYDINQMIDKSKEYYKYIDETGKKLDKIISEKIEPLLKERKFKEAKKMVRDFYDSSRVDDEVIFVEYDLILFDINRKMIENK